MTDAIIQALKDFAAWLLSLVQDVFTAIWDFCIDIIIEIFDLLMIAIAALIVAIPAPEFGVMSLGAVMGGIHPMIQYFGAGLRLPEGLAMIGAAVLFRLTRKALTLFQW